MSQRTIAQQIAEAQNVLVALSKQVQVTADKKVQSITVSYSDGSTDTFVKQPLASEILAQLRVRHTEVETAEDPLPAKVHLRGGFACIINGVRYNSIMHASRVLNKCRHGIKKKLDKNEQGYQYV